MSGASRKLTDVQELQQFETYKYDGELRYLWPGFQSSYKRHAEDLQALMTQGTKRELASWRHTFRQTNDEWSSQMGEVEYTKYDRVIDGRRSTFSKLLATSTNILRFFVTRATHKCDQLVMVLETLRRNEERAAAALGNDAHALLAMRACLDAREALF